MKLFKLFLVVLLIMSSFVLGSCKPSVPGTYLYEKDGTLSSAELKPDGTYLLMDNKGGQVGGKYIVKDNAITFTMYGKENKGEVKGDSIIMENGDVWKKKK